jgi:hypothetical protein
MIFRYENADESLTSVFKEVIEERFPSLAPLNFKLIYDTKKVTKSGRTILASIELPGQKLRFFTSDSDVEEGYDYILYVNQKAWEFATEKDRKRLLSHELRHVFIDEKGNCKIIGHEIEDFYAELELNRDDPEWGRNLATLVTDYYDQEKDMAKGNTGG